MGQFSCKSAARQLCSIPDKLCCFILKKARYLGIRFGISAIVNEPNPPQPHTDTRRQRPHILRSCQNSKALFWIKLGCPFRPPSVWYGSYSVAENFPPNVQTPLCPSFLDCILLFDYSIIFTHFVHTLMNNCCIFYVFLQRTLRFLSNTFSNTPSKNVQTWVSTIVGL